MLSDLLASSSVAVVNETLYLALFSRLYITAVVPLGCRAALRRSSRHNSRSVAVVGDRWFGLA